MALTITYSPSMIIAVVLAEVLSMVWFANVGGRNILVGIFADALLVIVLKAIMDKYWSVRDIKDAVMLSLWLGALYGGLAGPHLVWGIESFSHFLFHTAHKIAVCLVMILSIFYFRKYQSKLS